MSFIHNQSCECIKSELDLFAIPSTQTSVEGGQWIHYKPLASLSDQAPLEFVIPGIGDEYLDLSHTLLHIEAKICKPDNSNYSEATEGEKAIGPVNNLLHSMFSQVDVYLNQKLISPPNNTYAYRSYIETLLNYGPEAAKSHLTSSLWYMDTANAMDTIIGEGNQGHKKRAEFTKKGKCVDLIGHLSGDIFNQEKFLINGIELRVKLVRSRDQFVLMASEEAEPKLKIIDATLLVRRVKINPSVLVAHAKALQLAPVKYPITRVDVKVLTIPTGVQGKSLDNIFLGQLPKRCVIGFTSNKAFNGDYTKNPFNFKHYDMNFLSLYIDGHQIPSKPLQPDFTNNNYVRSYNTLFSGTGIHFSNNGLCISREEYPHGYCLTAFDLTPDLAANTMTHWNLIRNGSLRLEVRFKEALLETVNCIIYAEFDNIIEIDKNRNVIVDYIS